MTEKNFENRVKAFLKSEGCWFVKYWGGSVFTKAGMPDLIICCNGYFIAVELKSDAGKPTKLQLHQIEQIKQSGGIAFVLHPLGFDHFKNLIWRLKDNAMES